MATKKSSSATKVTRLKARDDEAKPAKKAAPPATTAAPAKQPSKNPLRAFGGYFKGSWQELRQVHWPTRRATWSLTGAMLVFTGILVVIILLLDALFKYLFEKILG